MMLSFLMWSLEGVPFALIYPGCWVGLVGLILVAVLVRRRPPGVEAPLIAELLVLAVGPLLLLLWGAALRNSVAGRPSAWTWQNMGMLCLFALVCFVAWGMTWRHRRRLRLVIPLAVLSVLWGGGALFIASMSITNDWI